MWDQEDGQWRRRHNAELRQLSQLPQITNIIKAHRLRWAGHVARLDNNRLAKRVMLGLPEGTRPLGRPRKRWVDNLKEDLIALGMEDSRQRTEAAIDRPEWKKLVKAARDLHGPRPME